MPPKPGECTPDKIQSITNDKERGKFISECNAAKAKTQPSSFVRAEQQAAEQRRNPIPAATTPPAGGADPGPAASVADPVANLFGGGLQNVVNAVRKPGNGRLGP
ncbi:MAG: hypothetical protein ACAH80_08250 [Alphaproteobacteria bacterium]